MLKIPSSSSDIYASTNLIAGNYKKIVARLKTKPKCDIRINKNQERKNGRYNKIF